MTNETIEWRVRQVRERIAAACERAKRRPEEVTLIGIAKGFDARALRAAAAAGIEDIGENRVQEAAGKRPGLTDLGGLRWHLVGHLQTNKVRAALDLFDIIHSVDSIHLAEAISRRASRTVPAFVEVNVAKEPTKTGFALNELENACSRIRTMPNLEILGLMTVAPIVERPEEARPVFRELRRAADSLALHQLSMGMTDDFEAAIEEGATHVRIGRAIFGERAG